jgi:hypothetical protein
MRIRNCFCADYKDKVWACNDNVLEGQVYLVTFEAADQFCHVIPLSKVTFTFFGSPVGEKD